MSKGFFITFEGPEGAGKSTVMKLLADQLRRNGQQVLETREPGGIEIAEQIRTVILDKKNTAMDPRTEALLYAAARRQHLIERVKPALDAGDIILCDRFLDSSLAYQGFARGLGMEEVYNINQFAIDGMMPILTLYFDIDPKLGLKRIDQHKEREVNRLDLEALEFHQKVRQGYHLLLERYPERIYKIDASQSIENVLIQVEKKVNELVKAN